MLHYMYVLIHIGSLVAFYDFLGPDPTKIKINITHGQCWYAWYIQNQHYSSQLWICDQWLMNRKTSTLNQTYSYTTSDVRTLHWNSMSEKLNFIFPKPTKFCPWTRLRWLRKREELEKKWRSRKIRSKKMKKKNSNMVRSGRHTNRYHFAIINATTLHNYEYVISD